jgi:hypothetical protein
MTSELVIGNVGWKHQHVKHAFHGDATKALDRPGIGERPFESMRRGFLGFLAGVFGLSPRPSAAAPAGGPKSKNLIKSAWGSADPTQAALAFHHANAFAEAGHEVQIFLLGEAVTLMRTAVASSVVWGPRERPGGEERHVREPVDLRRSRPVGGQGAD